MTNTCSASTTPKVLFVTTTPAVHKSGAFRLLGNSMNVLYLFFSRGREPYASASATPAYDGLDHQNIGAAARGRSGALHALVRAALVHDYDVMVKCINGKAELLACYFACRLRRRKFVLWTGIWSWPDNLTHRLGRPLVRHICRNADAVCTYGSHVSRFLSSEGVREHKLFTVRQPVQPDRTFHASGRGPYLPRGHLRVLFVGRLVQEKGLATLLQAASPMADRVVLTVAGDGPQRAALQAQAARARLQVEWVGEQEPADLAELYRQSDCVVIPSVTTSMTREPWSFVANEAMLSGCVVVASTAVGAVAGGLIQDEVTGLVFREGDHDALQRQLERLMDPSLCESLSRAAEGEARRFTEEGACADFTAAVLSVLSPQTALASKPAARCRPLSSSSTER